MKVCKQCKAQFEITDADRAFYNKIQVPEPTLCPDCRAMRRLSFRNERSIYKRECDLCRKEIIAIYPSDSKYKVYCPACWHSDSWNAFDFGRDFDFKRPFFEQFYKLKFDVPRISLDILHCENSEYSNISMYNRNCYLVFGTLRCEDCFYTRKAVDTKSSLDLNNVAKSELCYECSNCSECYNSNFIHNSVLCTDCNFIMDCSNLMSCTFCVGLKNKKYCFMNQQLSKEDYENKVAALHRDSYAAVVNAAKQFYEFSLRFPRRSTENINCQDCTGDYLRNCKSCYNCFEIGNSENSKFASDAMEGLVDSMDCTASTMRCNSVYECQSCTTISSCYFCNNVRENSSHIQYSDLIYSSHDLFGCVGFKNAEYCILNKKYSKQEYLEMAPKIIEYMRSTGEYGEFFPATISPFGYNEALGADFFPLTQDEAQKRQFNWNNKPVGVFGKETIKASELPDSINEVSENIIHSLISCAECGRNYKIIRQELDFYKKKSLPIPRECPDCRNRRRIRMFNPRKLWHRKCAKCSNEFETTYAPDRKELVFCEECYLKEVD